MQLIETSLSQRGQLPLPSAHIVIDMRGISDDRVIEWLQVEIADLASEMKSHDIYHWRYLSEFLSFMQINPTSDGAAPPAQAGNDVGENSAHGLMGQIYATSPEEMLFAEEMRDPAGGEDMPFNLFEQKVKDLIREIDRVRNNRIAAVKDLNTAAIPGRSRSDSTVRVVFLTDIDHAESLTSAALYAERLKNHYRKLERDGHQPMISTTVVCLSNSGEAGPPAALIQGLSLHNKWEHIDSLILSENYRQDAALISGTTQAYITELLLYVLLIIPPLEVSASDTSSNAVIVTPANSNGTHNPGANDTENIAQQLGLPAQTYVVGLAALEYSARWGRRWLNFGLAHDIIDIMRQKPINQGKEKMATGDAAASWFDDWRQRVQHAIPDQVPGDAPALKGIQNAQQANGKPSFAARNFSFQIGKSTITDLHRYLTRLTQTYVASGGEQALQDALVQGSPQIMQILREGESRPARERQANELTALQIEAERVLSHPRFFQGATGAIPRAVMQLEAIGSAVDHVARAHQQQPLNPLSTKDSMEKRKSNLESLGNRMIENLKQHIAHWPFLAGARPVRWLMAGLTLLLIAFLICVAVFAGAAWLHHLLLIQNSGILPFFDSVVLGIPVMMFIAIIVAILGLLIELLLLRPVILAKKMPGWYVEFAFLITLVVIGLFGWFISFSISSLGNSPNDLLSIRYLAWFAFMPGLGFVAILLAGIIFLVEVGYFAWWLDYLRRERRRITSVLRQKHREDIQEVISFIADDVALEIAQRAELYNSKTNLGTYYTRLSRLSELVDKLARAAQDQQQLAAERLLFKQNDTLPGADNKIGSVWLNLHIRDEKLEMEPLTDAYKGLRRQLTQENPAMKELAEFVLRSEGAELPGDIEREMLERPDFFANNERRLQLFLTSLMAITMRFAIDPVSLRNVEPLDKEYQNMQASWEDIPALTSLIQTLNRHMSLVMLSFSSKNGESYRANQASSSGKSLAASAAALWGQFFWLHNSSQLDQILMPEGILKHLERQAGDDYDPRAVMRRLLMHTVLFGRSLGQKQHVDLYLLLAPSPQSYHFRQALKGLAQHSIIDFPDVERILMLGVQRFESPPLQLPAPAVQQNSSAP